MLAIGGGRSARRALSFAVCVTDGGSATDLGMALSAELTAVSLGPIRWAPGDPGRLLKVSSEAMQNFVPLSLTSP